MSLALSSMARVGTVGDLRLPSMNGDIRSRKSSDGSDRGPAMLTNGHDSHSQLSMKNKELSSVD